MTRNSLLLTLVLFGLSCDRTKLQKVLPPNVRVDAYSQEAASNIDVLWVIDNSGSMAPRQENLAKNFQAFMDVFQKSGINFRIAVTTSDIFKEKGAFVGNPKILTPTTPNVASTFANNVRVGTMGSPYEAGLEAAQLALEKQAQANAPKLVARDTCKMACNKATDPMLCAQNCDKANPIDFLRPEAYLYLVFVTDEEDTSSQDVRYFWRAFETAKGIGNDGTVTTAAIMGECTTNCTAARPCQVNCHAGASCTLNCAQGSCQVTGSGSTSVQHNCNDASACNTTCTNVASCKQTAGSGTHFCMGCN